MPSIIWIPGESNIERWMYFEDFYLQLWMEMMDPALKTNLCHPEGAVLRDRRVSHGVEPKKAQLHGDSSPSAHTVPKRRPFGSMTGCLLPRPHLSEQVEATVDTDLAIDIV